MPQVDEVRLVGERTVVDGEADEQRDEAERDAVHLRHVEARRRPWRCRSGRRRSGRARGWPRASPSQRGSRGVVRTCLPRQPRDSRTGIGRTPFEQRDLALRFGRSLVISRHRRRIGILARTTVAGGVGEVEPHLLRLRRAAAADGRPASRRTCRGCDARPTRRLARASRVRGTRCRRSSGCRAARRTTNQPLSRRSLRFPRAAARPWFEITCAVPVLPATSLPCDRALVPPVPPPLTTIHMPSRIACSFSGSMSNFDCGGGVGTGFQPLPSSTALTRCGVTRVPPLASVAM